MRSDDRCRECRRAGLKRAGHRALGDARWIQSMGHHIAQLVSMDSSGRPSQTRHIHAGARAHQQCPTGPRRRPARAAPAPATPCSSWCWTRPTWPARWRAHRCAPAYEPWSSASVLARVSEQVWLPLRQPRLANAYRDRHVAREAALGLRPQLRQPGQRVGQLDAVAARGVARRALGREQERRRRQRRRALGRAKGLDPRQLRLQQLEQLAQVARQRRILNDDDAVAGHRSPGRSAPEPAPACYVPGHRAPARCSPGRRARGASSGACSPR